MKFLCLDTTLNNCSIHIVSPGKECLTVSDNQVPPSDVIPILVKKAMLKLNLKISDIDGIIVATGPGNFTSLRVGISFGVGLSKSLSIPIYGVSSLQSLVFSFREEIKKNENFLVTIKARGEDYFFQPFDNIPWSRNAPWEGAMDALEPRNRYLFYDHPLCSSAVVVWLSKHEMMKGKQRSPPSPSLTSLTSLKLIIIS